MKRFVLALAAGLSGLALSGCGSISASSAMVTWVAQSGYVANAKALTTDAAHAANELRLPSAGVAQLHTVCAVLLLESEQANSSLPSPDDQSTTLLSRAYSTLGAGANQCYGAASSPTMRAKALASLSAGVADLAEASARISAVSLTP